MRAVVVAGPGEVTLAERPRPQPGDGELLVRVAWAAVCGTDRKLAVRGSEHPRVPGHELAGHGPDGRPVGIHPDIGCGHCRHCAAGLPNRCSDRTSIGLDRDGGLAGWVTVPAAHVIPLNGVGLSLGPLIEPLACCLHAVDQLPPASKAPALVVGAGAMGVLMTWALQAAGWRVAVSQRSAPRRRLVAELGADLVFAPNEAGEELAASPPPVAVVTAPGVGAVRWALERVAVGGTVHAFAGTPGEAPVDANVVHYRHLRLVGTTGSTLEAYRRAVSVVARGNVPLARLPCEEIPLREAAGALVTRPHPTLLRTLVRIEGGDQ